MKHLTRIALLCAVLTAFLCAAARAGNDAPSVQVTGRPTVNGLSIYANHLDGLEEIAVPVQVSSDAPTNVKLFASFYDGDGKYIGMGATSADVDSETSFVIMPVESKVTGAETLKMSVTDADFRPLSVSSYSLTGGGAAVSYYYAKVNASVTPTADNVAHGKVFLTTTAPTAAWTAPAPADANDAQTSASYTYNKINNATITGYAVFAPDAGYELDGAITATSAADTATAKAVTLGAPTTVTLADGATKIAYCSFTTTGTESNAPIVTISAAFKRTRAFAYNLIIFGKGSVTVDFNGKSQTFTNDTDNMKTTSYSEVIDGVDKVNVSVSQATPGDGYFGPLHGTVLMNDTSLYLGAPYAMSEGTVDIVVEFGKSGGGSSSGGFDHDNETPIL